MLSNILLGLGCALMIAALYLVFIYAPTEEAMGDVQRIFYFHVALAWVAFLAFFVVFICSILYLWKRDVRWDTVARSSAELGVVFTTLVLITGPIWARPVWGVWWTWDARLTATLVLWLTYVAYLLVRGFATEESRGARFAAVLGIVGFIDVPIVYLAIHLWRTHHPPALVGDLVSSMLLTLLVSVAAFTLLFIILLKGSVSVRNMEAEVRHLKDSKMNRRNY
ncbi:MAG TPA: cytochrome c biogenesis protein CcsA [Dehalococcoidia bacterium]|nr:cytochrome c biogenesis protein CcsA [Dehalococcoidia bacterium]